MQTSMSLHYEPAWEPLRINVKQLFLAPKPSTLNNKQRAPRVQDAVRGLYSVMVRVPRNQKVSRASIPVLPCVSLSVSASVKQSNENLKGVHFRRPLIHTNQRLKRSKRFWVRVATIDSSACIRI